MAKITTLTCFSYLAKLKQTDPREYIKLVTPYLTHSYIGVRIGVQNEIMNMPGALSLLIELRDSGVEPLLRLQIDKIIDALKEREENAREEFNHFKG
ncbi:MAG: hypothetical protein U9Q21_03210 [Candidatus Auribacterota bacterium]|nr:hypothetical protein [Candidatus Auribacterota bacterium]